MPERQDDLYRIVYDSIVMLPFGCEGVVGLRNIVSTARARNAGLGITGVLYFDGAYFMQVLEGPRVAVLAVFSSILHDPRHADIKISDSSQLLQRDFPDWSMALVDETTFDAAQSGFPFITRLNPDRVSRFVCAMCDLISAGAGGSGRA